MNYPVRYLILMTLVCSLTYPPLTQGAVLTKTVAVADFPNLTDWSLPHSAESANEILSTLLSQNNLITVVKRTKFLSAQTEQGLSLLTLANSTSAAVQVGKLLGADYVVSGAIFALDAKEAPPEEAGLTTPKINYELTLTVKLIRVETGLVEYSAFHTAREILPESEGADRIPIATIHKLLVRVLSEAVRGMELRITKQPLASARCYVKILSRPGGANVVIDNIYYGTTPLYIHLNPGLHQLRIGLSGYEPWLKQFVAAEGLTVNAELARKGQ